jgi:hypothetical protein
MSFGVEDLVASDLTEPTLSSEREGRGILTVERAEAQPRPTAQPLLARPNPR